MSAHRTSALRNTCNTVKSLGDAAAAVSTEPRSGLSRSREVTCMELVEKASIRAVIFRCGKFLPRRPFGVSARNWCHFTVRPRPRQQPPIQSGASSSYVPASPSAGVGRPTYRTMDPPGLEMCSLTNQVGGLAATAVVSAASDQCRWEFLAGGRHTHAGALARSLPLPWRPWVVIARGKFAVKTFDQPREPCGRPVVSLCLTPPELSRSG